jgi:hypothetical protein
MASAWIEKREGKTGTRFRVEFRPMGWARPVYGGSFKTKREAVARRAWITGELAAMRVPDIRALGEVKRSQTLTEAAERWRASRVDVTASTRVLHRVALDRVLPILGTRHVDEITTADVAGLIAELHAAGKKRATIRKSLIYLAQVLDHAGVQPNPARDRVQVKLPREEREELEPPTASHVAAVYRTVPSVHRLPLLFLDWSGARVKAIDTLLSGITTSPAAVCGSVPPRRRPAELSGWSCIRISQKRSQRLLGRARIATPMPASSRTPARMRCEPRSRRRAGRSGFRSGRLTTFAIGGFRSCICEACRGCASANRSVRETSPSPPTPTRT